MSRTTMTAAFAVILAASTPMAFAADTGATNTAPPAHTTATPAPHTGMATTAENNGAVTETQLQPDQIRASKLKGADVNDSQNKKIGSVKDIILDKSGKVAAVVLDVDSKNVAVGMQDLKVATDNGSVKITTDKTKDQLKSAQAFDLNSEKTAGSGSSSGGATIPPAGNNK